MARLLSHRHLFAALSGAAVGSLAGPRTAAAADTAPALLVTLATPKRVADTRTDPFPGRKLRAGDNVAFAVAGDLSPLPDIPVAAVFLNVTVTETEGAGFLAVRRDDESGFEPPVVHSNINWSTGGQTLANLALSMIGAESSVAVLCSGTGATHVILDVLGYVPASPLVPGPARGSTADQARRPVDRWTPGW